MMSPESSSAKSNPASCTDPKNSTGGRRLSTNENKTYESRQRFSEREPCLTGRRAPSQVATIAVHAGQGSSTSDATAPSAPDSWTTLGEISMCPGLPDIEWVIPPIWRAASARYALCRKGPAYLFSPPRSLDAAPRVPIDRRRFPLKRRTHRATLGRDARVPPVPHLRSRST